MVDVGMLMIDLSYVGEPSSLLQQKNTWLACENFLVIKVKFRGFFPSDVRLFYTVWNLPFFWIDGCRLALCFTYYYGRKLYFSIFTFMLI